METQQNEEKTGPQRITFAPRFFDLVLPELVEKGVLTVRNSTEVQAILRDTGSDQAAVRLTELLKLEKNCK